MGTKADASTSEEGSEEKKEKLAELVEDAKNKLGCRRVIIRRRIMRRKQCSCGKKMKVMRAWL